MKINTCKNKEDSWQRKSLKNMLWAFERKSVKGEANFSETKS